MRCPTLAELPPPDTSKTGWPWTQETILQNKFVDITSLPFVTIVTPSYNQGQFIEETIRSILLQNYPFLDYIIIDGGSSDNSVEVIKNYEPWLSYWVSEPDGGQSHALAKGFKQAKGELMIWINSDDVLAEGALLKVGKTYKENPNQLIAGNVVNFTHQFDDGVLIRQKNVTLDNLLRVWRKAYVWHQPGLFFPRFLYEKVGGINQELHYAMDHDLFIKLLQFGSISYRDETVSFFRLHKNSKTVSQNIKLALEVHKVAYQYKDLLPQREQRFLKLNLQISIVKYAVKHLLRGNLSNSLLLIKSLSMFQNGK